MLLNSPPIQQHQHETTCSPQAQFKQKRRVSLQGQRVRPSVGRHFQSEARLLKSDEDSVETNELRILSGACKRADAA